MPGEARFALLLHGRVGNVMMPPSESLRHSDAEVAAGGLHGLVRLLAASHLEHVVVPNEADVFLHSWNPGLGLLLDAQYGPSLQGSLHEPVNASLEKAASQALSIARCAQLASKRETARARPYQVAVVMRLDAVPLEPLPLRQLSPSHLTFSEQCCMVEADASDRVAVRTACGHKLDLSRGFRGVRWNAQKRVISFCRVQQPNRRKWLRRKGLLSAPGADDAANDLRYYVQDWWFAAPLAVVLSWATIARRWSWYEERSMALGFYLTGHKLWSNIAWPLHVHDVLSGAQIRFVAWHVALGRHVYRPLLFNSAGKLGGDSGAPCHQQAFDPGALLATPALDAELRRRARAELEQSSGQSRPWLRCGAAAGLWSRRPSLEPCSGAVRPELGRVFEGRFRSMAMQCPAASFLPERSVVCCGNTSFARRWCGPRRRHQRACRQAWRSLQPRLDGLNRTLLVNELDPSGRKWVGWWNSNSGQRCNLQHLR